VSAPSTSSRRPSLEIVGLFLVYAAAAGLALWQGLEHSTPTIFTDEIEMTQLARSLAETGHATLRGQPYLHFVPLAAYLAAPFWWISDVPTAYSLIKASNALIMTAAVFPAYGLARLVVSSRWALFAAAGTGFSPALAYAPILVKEPTAYPACTLALLLIARFVARPSRGRLLLAIAGCLFGALAKDQLKMLFGVLALAGLALLWRSERMRSFRGTWTRLDWIGAVTLAIGGAAAVGSIASHKSDAWYVSTTFFQDRLIQLGLSAGGALAIGLGVVPLVAGLASLVRPKSEPPTPGVDALAIVTVSTIVCFGMYTAVKAVWLSTRFATLVLERNLIFLVPLLFAGTALFLQRRRGRWWAVLGAGAVGLYLVHITPYSLTQYPNYEAHGLAIIALANRIFTWPAETIEHALVVVTICATLLLVLLSRVHSQKVASGIVGLLAVFTLVWTGTTEVYAANGERTFSNQMYATLPKPANWLDKETRGRSTVFLGQGVRDTNPVNLLEFWNKSLTKVWALDGTAPGPGATATPNVDKPNGTLTDPGTDFAIVTRGVDVQGQPQGAPVGDYRLFQLSGGLRLRTAQTGVEPDGWMGSSAGFSQYDVPPGQRGKVRIDLSRASWCGKDVRSTVTIRVGPVLAAVGEQSTIGSTTSAATGVIHSCQVKTFLLPTPAAPWRAEVTIDPTFSPAELDPTLGDQRHLGAVPSFTYIPER
jgi:hypothetical protein